MADIDLRKAQIVNPVAWALQNHLVNENGSPIEFKDHAFLIDPYLDYSPRQVTIKCAQIGWSTLAILKAFHLARYGGANIIHTFPSRNMSKEFVAPKVDPLIQKNKVIRDMIGADSAYLKQIGDRFIYYRGSYEQTEAISISAHVLINDEYDRSNSHVLKTYRSRLDDAKRERPELGWEWQFSNPSFPGTGVDVWWQKSDQKHWFVKCKRCKREWYLNFPESINFDTQEKVCSKCGKPYTYGDLIGGRWVKKYNDRDISGYWISQMFVPWISAAKIIEDSQGDQDIFHNFCLGLPFLSKDTTVSREVILKCLSPGYNPRSNVAIGVDNGVHKHYVIGNKYGIFDMGVTDDWEDIESMRNRYNAIMVIDAMPYPNTPQKMATKYPGKVYIHYYQQDRKNIGTLRWEDRVVHSDRTKIIDSVVADFNAGDITINMTEHQLEDYIKHWGNIYRIVKPTTQGISKPSWETIENREDHFAHATIYWRIALERTIGQGAIVNTPRPVSSKTKKSPVVASDGTVPALDLNDVVERASKKKKGWQSV